MAKLFFLLLDLFIYINIEKKKSIFQFSYLRNEYLEISLLYEPL